MTYQLFSPWRNEALDFAIAVERAGRLIRAARRGLAAVNDLSLANWRLLVMTRDATARSQSGLARRLRVSRQSVHSMARLLQSTGHLAVTRGFANRKSMMTNDIPRETLVAATHRLNRFSARLRQCETILRRQRPDRPKIRRA